MTILVPLAATSVVMLVLAFSAARKPARKPSSFIELEQRIKELALAFFCGSPGFLWGLYLERLFGLKESTGTMLVIGCAMGSIVLSFFFYLAVHLANRKNEPLAPPINSPTTSVGNTDPSKLRFNGFYQSGPYEWEDWHAGVRMHGIRFHYKRYYPNGDWLRCYRDHEFDFWGFAESVTPELLAQAKRCQAPTIADYDPLCEAGTYTFENGILVETLVFDSLGGHVVTMRFDVSENTLTPANAKNAIFVFEPRGA